MKIDKRTVALATVFGFTTAFCFGVGDRIGAEGSKRLGVMQICISIVWMTLLIGGLCILLWKVFPRIRQSRVYTYLYDKTKDIVLPFSVRMLVLLLLWLPAYLAIFPGAFAYDSPTQWEQFSSGQITTHHPVIHTLLLGVCLDTSYQWFSNYNVGIAVYTILQMIAMAAIFSYTISFLRKYNCPVILRGMTFLFYGLSPVVHLFVVSSTKDTLFTGVFLLFLLALIDFGFKRKEFFEKRSRQIYFVLTAIGTMCLRKNGFYIVVCILVGLFCFVFFFEKANRKKFLYVLLAIAAFYAVYTGPVYKMLDVKEGSVSEMLSVPIQQMARVYTYHYYELEEEDILLFEEFIPKQNLLAYTPTVVDRVKANFRDAVFQEKKMEFFKLWVKWGIKYPSRYISSFLIGTADYWYPKAIIDGYYPGDEIISYSRYSVGEPGQRIEMLPKVYRIYKALAEHRSASELPFMYLILSPGWYLVMTMFLVVTQIYRRKWKVMLPYVAIGLTEITAFLGPIAQVRYVLILFFAFPIMLSFMLIEDKQS